MEYDILIVGSGAGGATLAYSLAAQGIKVLLLERGDFLPREKENWDPKSVFVDMRYHAPEEWYDKEGRPFRPGTHYYVGGNTKLFGAALLRLRETDFKEVKHWGGISPAWPLGYEAFAPYYLAAEKLYAVHGQRGEDPTEPEEEAPYFYPPVSHEPYIQEIVDRLKEKKFSPFHLPMAIRLNEKDREASRCIRCDTCDGFPCLVHAKADAHTTCVLPALQTGNVELMRNCRAVRLITDTGGKCVTGVVVEKEGSEITLSAPIVVVSCGAINSAALLLRSKHKEHPNGLANSSGLVGRNYMCHNNSVIIAVSTRQNPVKFQKTVGINDFYHSAPDSPLPLGHMQLLGKVKKGMLEAEAPRFAPGIALEYLADHCVGWWITSEDLPDPENRVLVDDAGKITLQYTCNNMEAHTRLREKLEEVLKSTGPHTHVFPNTVYLSQQIPIAGVAHQAGTLRFGSDPKTSVLDLNCKAHDLDNLYVVDSSFFPSIGAVNPSLTVIANALRVADILAEQM